MNAAPTVRAAGVRDTRAPFLTHKQYMAERYGAPLYRVPVDFGFGCPNRQSDGSGGCVFCDGSGARAVFVRPEQPVEEQVRQGVAFARRRYGTEHFMAYVQAFTATAAPVAEQRAMFARLLGAQRFEALSVGTRPDCLPPETLDLLAGLGERKTEDGRRKHGLDVWVELGVQTVHDETLRRIERGHDWACSRRAILDLHARGVLVAAHVILGLPGETAEHFARTASELARLPVAAVKIHNLHVLSGSALARQFREQPFAVMDEREYGEVLIDFLRRLPPGVAIMRLNTDTPPERLIAPRWRMGKGAFLAFVERTMFERGVRQGDRVGTPERDGPPAPSEARDSDSAAGREERDL